MIVHASVQARIPMCLSLQEDEPQIHLLYPLMYMHGVYSNMLDKVYRRMEVSWTVFRGADSGELVVVRSEPRIIDFVQTDMEGQCFRSSGEA